MVKNIVFDIGRVLVDYDWESYLDSFGFSPEVRARVAAAVFQNKDWGELDRGAIPEEEVLARFIAKAPEVETEIRKVWGHVFETIHERPYPPQWIQALKKRGFGVYYLSNYSWRGCKDTKEILDTFVPLMDGGIFSCEVELIKPDPAIYRTFVEKFGLRPEECLFVDDIPANVEGARSIGMRAEVFTTAEVVWKLLEALPDPK